MSAELQSWAAGAIVLVTVGIFLTRSFRARLRSKGGGSCSTGCGCSAGAKVSAVPKQGK